MRLVVTADLHFNHARSRSLAEDLIQQINRAGGDVLLLVGDTAAGDGDALERALGLFRFRGPKLFVAGNHELWTLRGDSFGLFSEELPRRVRALGWHWLEGEPFCLGASAIVGSIGWYDYSFAVPELHIPLRYYQAKISPGIAQRLSEHAHLVKGDESPHSFDIFARWNDGRYITLGKSDQEFLNERLKSMQAQLNGLGAMRSIVVAVHHVPFSELLPPRRGMQWDFARAYLGSERIGELLRRFENITHAFCGHSHWPAQATVGSINAVNIGSGYRSKAMKVLDL